MSPYACRMLTLAPRLMGSSIACSRIVDHQKEGQGQRHAQFPSHRVVRVLHLPRQAITPLNEAADTTGHSTGECRLLVGTQDVVFHCDSDPERSYMHGINSPADDGTVRSMGHGWEQHQVCPYYILHVTTVHTYATSSAVQLCPCRKPRGTGICDI